MKFLGRRGRAEVNIPGKKDLGVARAMENNDRRPRKTSSLGGYSPRLKRERKGRKREREGKSEKKKKERGPTELSCADRAGVICSGENYGILLRIGRVYYSSPRNTHTHTYTSLHFYGPPHPSLHALIIICPSTEPSSIQRRHRLLALLSSPLPLSSFLRALRYN